MVSVLNYSENDFPSLGTSINSKARKRNHKSLSSIVSLNANSSKCVDDQPNRRGNANEICALETESEKSFECKPSNEKSAQSWKPKPTESVTIGDFLKCEKPCPRNRPRATKNVRDGHVLSGNPLDTDCPVRFKGFMNLPKKSKSLSKIKAVVHKAREEKKKIKDYSTQISFLNDAVLVRSDIPEEYLWKSVVYGKAKDLKCIINYEGSETDEEKSCNDADPVSNDSNEETKLSCSSNDEELCYRISLRKLLQQSEVPPFKLLIHHHNFKSYCDNCITEELNRAASALISQIVRYQDNKYQTNPSKAMANKRYVVGFKQTSKYLKMNKIKVFIIVPDMEDSLSDTVEELKLLANACCIPYYFALSRRKLGFLTHKKVGVCCFGILDHSGAETKFDKTIVAMTKAKMYYKEKCAKAQEFYESYFRDLSETDESVTENMDEIIQKFNENLLVDETAGECNDST